MAINKNHEFEELDGVKCGIAEKNASPQRVAFLRKLLEHNHFTVIVVPSPLPKAVPAKPAATTVNEGEAVTTPEIPAPQPTTFTIGVTDYTFNPINAIFGRLLKTLEGGLVTQAYWYQKEVSGKDEVPYYERS